ncbi:glycoprotease family-domain-containing protein [Crepidotus variabilis]|uniref:N(6)-L-threonylcarbamoyladenine synthase n=1 Tax=Crepidotus variabilis TaxID=179855 RepID=A0A9P6EI54_9AGAR|nr:glycoprotease family-domain-containing protein [Crepidotus variabilis]
MSVVTLARYSIFNSRRIFGYLGRRHLTILGIESSADDTCAAIVDSDGKIHSNVVIKQHDVHEVYGGINPLSAIHSHQSNMPFAVKRALKEANLDLKRDIDGIAFTRGPGMAGCLSVGMDAAKTLAAALEKPLVGVHHMQAHALTVMLTERGNEPKFPFLTLLISGGHTLLLLAKSVNEFKLLATTNDESIGRSFDKVSKLLKLKWTNLGPGDALEKFVAETDDSAESTVTPITRPLPGQLAFSYSAHHSQTKALIESHGGVEGMDIATKRAIAREFQTAAVGHLEEKLVLGLNWCRKRDIHVRDVVVSGGVASNSYLRERLRRSLDKYNSDESFRLFFPPPYLCTDNAAMIAWASTYRFSKGDTDDYSVGLLSKWDLKDLNAYKT